MVTLPNGYVDVSAYAQDLLALIHEPLSVQITGGIHVNDAFIYDAWGQLPKEWTDWWRSISDYRDAQKDLITHLEDSTEPRATTTCLPGRPESLTRWLGQVRGMSLSRKQIVFADGVDVVVMPEALTGHMNTKKLAEVQMAARYIQHTCRRNGIRRIVDVGSGQGYLSLILAAVCGFNVLAIDGSSKQIEGSRAAARAAGLVEGQEITHLVRFVDGSAQLSAEVQTWSNNEPCMLVGLHACGSLSEHMIRLFTNTPSISHLAVAGCCYNHITPRSPSHPDGFPISRYMRANDLRLSTSAMITGCQAPTNWVHNPASPYARKHFYRAVLEKLLHDNGIGDPDHRLVWGIRTGDLRDFRSYTTRALDRLGVQLGTDITESDIDEYEKNYRGREGETAILWTLSVMLCRIVESVIALDRWYYLVESGAEDVQILPMFEYKTSPRNLMLVASKTKGDGEQVHLQ